MMTPLQFRQTRLTKNTALTFLWAVTAAVVLALGGCIAEDSSTESGPIGIGGGRAETDESDAHVAAKQGSLVLHSHGLELTTLPTARDTVSIGLSPSASVHLRSERPAGLGEFEVRDGQLVRANSEGCKEIWEAVPQGLRQSWYFPTDPEPGEDLVVRVALENGTASARTDQGIIIKPDAGGPLAYGRATWIDSAGHQTSIGAAYGRAFIDLVVPAAVLASTTFPATLDPVISGSLDPFTPVPTLATPYVPSVACTSSACRVGFYVYASSKSEGRAAQVNTSGVLQTPVSEDVGPPSGPNAVASLGGTFMHVWEDSHTIRAQLFSSAGAPLSAPLNIGSGYVPVVTASNNAFMVAWVSSATIDSVSTRLVSASGTLLTPTKSFVLTTGSNVTSAGVDQLAASSNGTDFAVAYSWGQELDYDWGNAKTFFSLLRLDSSLGQIGTTIGLGGGPFANVGTAIDVASDGVRDVVVFANTPTTSKIGGYAPPGYPLTTQTIPGATGARIRCTTDDCLVVYHSGTTLAALPLLQGVGTAPFTLAGYAGFGISTVSSTNYIIATSSNTLVFASANGLEPPLNSGPYSYIGDSNSGVAIATPTGTLVYGRSGNGNSCFGTFVSEFGVPGAQFPMDCFGSIFYGDGNYFQSTTGNGQILDSTFTPSAPAVDVTASGELFSTAFRRDGEFKILVTSSAGIGLERFSDAGTLIGSATVFPGSSPSATATPAGSLVSAIQSGSVIVRPLDATDTPGAATTFGSASEARIAWGETNAGLTWSTTAGSYFRLTSETGVGVGPAAYSLGSNRKTPRVAFDGSGYVILMRGTTAPYLPRVRRIRADGTLDGAEAALPLQNEDNPNLGVVRVDSASQSKAVAYGNGYTASLSAPRVLLVYVGSDAHDGVTCSVNTDCLSGFCVDGVCCESSCGGGAPDCQACSVSAGGQTDGTCTPLVSAASVQCRAAAAVCDAPEFCDPGSMICPADVFLPSGAECRAANGPCDVAEACTGLTAGCPIDQFLPAGNLCRAAAGDCDAAEACTGASAACPSDLAAPAGTTCRAVAGPCDQEEQCDGTGMECPPDSFVPASAMTECRAAAGACDVADMCDGSGSQCPADGVAPSGVECRAASDLCDLAEQCDGINTACPPDLLASQGTPCRAATSECDVDDFCDGSTAICTDTGKPKETPCGAAQLLGPCDQQDTCSGGPGASNKCTDWISTETLVCRPAAGECDAEEHCNAKDYACPADDVVADGTACDEGVCNAGSCVAPPGTGDTGDTSSSSSGGDDGSTEGGCSCQTAGSSSTSDPPRFAALILLGLVIAGRRSRRKHGGTRA